MLRIKPFFIIALVLCIVFSSALIAAPAYAAGGVALSEGISIIGEDIEAISDSPESYSWLLIASIVCAVAAAAALTALIVTTVTFAIIKRK